MMNESGGLPRPLINIQNASVVLSGRCILDNLSLRIEDGENTAIIGPNGSGKSTLIKLITRQLYPLAGRDLSPVVEIFGRDRWNVFELRSMLGILSNDQQQDFADDPDLDGFETVLSGFFASKGLAPHQTVTAPMREAAHHVIDLVGARPLASKRLAQMSTGEVRKILIARALVSAPVALMLDEPTAGLDLAARRSFLVSVRQVAQQGKTVVLVTHHVEEIIPEIDRIVLMKDGAVFRDGTKGHVLTSQTLSELFGERIDIRERDGYYSADIELLSSNRVPDLD